jgi:hypothetical protein
MTLRLLMPAGICACKTASPAGRMVAALLHTKPPPPPSEFLDDDHSPGCPASIFSTGLGVAPPAGPGLFHLRLFSGEFFSLPTPTCSALDSASWPAPADRAPLIDPGGGLYLTLCALLI